MTAGRSAWGIVLAIVVMASLFVVAWLLFELAWDDGDSLRTVDDPAIAPPVREALEPVGNGPAVPPVPTPAVETPPDDSPPANDPPIDPTPEMPTETAPAEASPETAPGPDPSWVPHHRWREQGGYLTGVVMDEAGFPLSGLRVWAVLQHGESPGVRASEHGQTDTDGTFRLQVYPGEYVVHVLCDVGEFRSAVYVVRVGETVEVTMPRVPPPAQVWWLTLKDGDGADVELPNAIVLFQPTGVAWFLRGTPVIPGRFDPPENAPPVPPLEGVTRIRLGIDPARARQYDGVALTGFLSVLPGNDRFYRLRREFQLPQGGGDVAIQLDPAAAVQVELRVAPDMVPLTLRIRTRNRAEEQIVQRIAVGHGGLTPTEFLDDPTRLRNQGIVREESDGVWLVTVRVGLPVETPVVVSVEATVRRGEPSPLNPSRRHTMDVSIPHLQRGEAFPVYLDLLAE